jgi:hypothetical protein
MRSMASTATRPTWCANSSEAKDWCGDQIALTDRIGEALRRRHLEFQCSLHCEHCVALKDDSFSRHFAPEFTAAFR